MARVSLFSFVALSCAVVVTAQYPGHPPFNSGRDLPNFFPPGEWVTPLKPTFGGFTFPPPVTIPNHVDPFDPTYALEAKILRKANFCRKYYLTHLSEFLKKVDDKQFLMHSVLRRVIRNLRTNVADVIQYYSLVAQPKKDTTAEFTKVEIVDLIHILRGHSDVFLTSRKILEKYDNLNINIPPCGESAKLVELLKEKNMYNKSVVKKILRKIFRPFSAPPIANVAKPIIVNLLQAFRFDDYSPDLIAIVENVAQTIGKLPNKKFKVNIASIKPDSMNTRMGKLLKAVLDESKTLTDQERRNIALLIRSLNAETEFPFIELNDIRDSLNIFRPPSFPRDIVDGVKVIRDIFPAKTLYPPIPGYTELQNAVSLLQSAKERAKPDQLPVVDAMFSFISQKYLHVLGEYLQPKMLKDYVFIFNSFANINPKTNKPFLNLFRRFFNDSNPYPGIALKDFQFNVFTNPRCIGYKMFSYLIDYKATPHIVKALFKSFLAINEQYIKPCVQPPTPKVALYRSQSAKTVPNVQAKVKKPKKTF